MLNETKETTMRFDKDLYDKEALLKAAYAFTDQVYIHLEQNEQSWKVSWETKKGNEITHKEFENELIFQKVRKIILKETSEVRSILLARAMASTVIDTSVLQTHDQSEITDDEKEILRNWYSNDKI